MTVARNLDQRLTLTFAALRYSLMCAVHNQVIAGQSKNFRLAFAFIVPLVAIRLFLGDLIVANAKESLIDQWIVIVRPRPAQFVRAYESVAVLVPGLLE